MGYTSDFYESLFPPILSISSYTEINLSAYHKQRKKKINGI